MIRHLLKLVWHRKRANALVMTEIFFSFLIVFAVATMGLSMISRWRTPLGYEWKNIWAVTVVSVAPSVLPGSTHTSTDTPEAIDPKLLRTAEEMDRLMRDLRTLPQIEAVAADSMPAYSTGSWTSSIGPKDHRADVTADFATDDFAKVMKLKVLRGRWFQPEDEGADFLPLVVDSDAAMAMFGKLDIVGTKLPAEGFRSDPSSPKDVRIVGVIAPYRKAGELSSETRMAFFRTSFVKPQTPETQTIVIAVRPGTPPSFEAQLNKHLHAVAPDATFRLRRMEQMRHLILRIFITPLAVLSVLALFLICMVTLGLTGVLWQTVTRRMREIGLRRALGATGHGVRAQVLGEVALLATLAVIAGSVIILQLPLLGILHLVTATELSAGFSGALAVIYAITLLCGAYPSWLASRIEPADALRYE
jgi:putative ABC transport system permease protein